MPEDAGDDRRPGEREDVETWPPEDEGQRPAGPAPDHEQARQGARDPTRAAGRGRGASMSDAEAENWAVGAHLSSLVALLSVPPVLGPLVVWLLKREDHPFVADQAREALNFQISVLIYTIVGVIAALAFTLATMGLGLVVVLPAAFVFVVGAFLLPIFAAIEASEGERFRYPFTLRVVSGSDRRA
jgi:uncharacterized Tic20 family protein